MESATTRCNIRNYSGFDEICEIISGGYLGLEGLHEDGTVKFETRAPEW
jgi:hypothetical protein